MTGAVNAALEAVIPLTLKNDIGELQDYDFTIDTGFTDYLSLRLEDLESLGLSEIQGDYVTLADGSRVLTRIFIGRVVWEGIEQIVPIQAAETAPLVGMQLLVNQRLTIDVHYNGVVRIEPLP